MTNPIRQAVEALEKVRHAHGCDAELRSWDIAATGANPNPPLDCDCGRDEAHTRLAKFAPLVEALLDSVDVLQETLDTPKEECLDKDATVIDTADIVCVFYKSLLDAGWNEGGVDA